MEGTLKIRPLESPQDTAREMRRIVETYHSDLGDLVNLPINEFYELVKALPYRADPKGLEFVSRPLYTLKKDFPIRDCDDKAVLLGAYLYANGIPFKFIGSSKKSDGSLHHVYVNALINGKELVLDATYPHNNFGLEESGIVHKIALTGEIMQSQFATLEGNELGFSFRKIGRRLKKVGKYGTIAAGGPVSVAAYAAWKNRKALKKSFSGDYLEGDELGRSLLDKIGTRIKKTSKKVGSATVKAAKKTGTLTKKGVSWAAKNPAIKSAIASLIPGGAAALELTRGGKKSAKNTEVEPQETGINKNLIIGGGILLLIGGGILFASNSKRK